MEIKTSNLTNLAFKELRKEPIAGIEVVKVNPIFNPIAWAKTQNTEYGVNYIIDEVGEITEILPIEYHTHAHGFNGRDKIGILVHPNAPEESLDHLKEHLSQYIPKEETKEAYQPDKADTGRSPVRDKPAKPKKNR